MSAPLNDRPVPLRDAFRSVGALVALLGGVVTSLAGWGVLTAAQADPILGLLGLIPGVVTIATALLAAFGVIKVAEPQVTPTADPAMVLDGELVPLVADIYEPPAPPVAAPVAPVPVPVAAQVAPVPAQATGPMYAVDPAYGAAPAYPAVPDPYYGGRP